MGEQMVGFNTDLKSLLFTDLLVSRQVFEGCILTNLGFEYFLCLVKIMYLNDHPVRKIYTEICLGS